MTDYTTLEEKENIYQEEVEKREYFEDEFMRQQNELFEAYLEAENEGKEDEFLRDDYIFHLMGEEFYLSNGHLGG